LSSVLSDHEITNVIKRSETVDVVKHLIEAVLERGAPDNVTILWVEIIEIVDDALPLPIELLGAAQ
jgi:serine/threonine protein phosphatase PrpC